MPQHMEVGQFAAYPLQEESKCKKVHFDKTKYCFAYKQIPASFQTSLCYKKSKISTTPPYSNQSVIQVMERIKEISVPVENLSYSNLRVSPPSQREDQTVMRENRRIKFVEMSFPSQMIFFHPPNL
jgi:hypothetical protein